MKLETFFEKFDQFADAPDGVKSMRELVLWSAFSGAFSAGERDQPMPEEWAVEGAPTLPAIPSSWKWQRGSEVFDVIRGVSYKKNDASDSPFEGSIPVLRANNIGNGINFDGLVYVPRDNIRDEQFVRIGDILIAMSSGSKKLVGKAAPIMTEFKGAFGAFCGIIRNKSGIPDEVLARYFQSPQYTSWVTAAGRGIGINNLGRGDLDSLPVPTPPLAEQKRIVAKVDELMALCDRLEAQQQERETRHAALARASLARFADAPTPANLKFLFHPSYTIPPADLRKSILTLAVQGKLVPQDPNDEPAEESVSFARAKSKLPKRAALPDDFDEKPFDLPTLWTWVTVSDVAESRLGKMLDKEKNRGEAHPYLRNTNVHWFRFELDSIKSMLFDPSEFTEYLVEPGDVLICEGGHGIARSAVWEGQIPGIMFQKALHRVRPLPCLIGNFLAFCLRVYEDAGILQRYYTGAGIPHFTGKALAKVTFPLPPIAEQRRIVAKVEQLMALVDALETQLAAFRASAANLLSALVAELTAT